jgi:hypothetical protein
VKLEHGVSCAGRKGVRFEVVKSADCGCVCSFAFWSPIPNFGGDTIVEGAKHRFETAAVVVQISTHTKHRVKAVKLFLGGWLSVGMD